MKLIFFGTPDFAIPVLEKIHKSKHELKAIVTAPDKERGRGRKVSAAPVKNFALQNDIPVLQPGKLKSSDFIEELKTFEADVFVVVAFRILPEEIFSIPKKGAFNLHGSLLPKYRGAAPIQWALINGEKESGLTTFFLKKKVDTGNIILQEKIKIDEEDNFGTLHDKMSEAGAYLVLKTLDLIEEGNAVTFEQDQSLVSPAPKITNDIRQIDWRKSAEEIHDLIRGLSPYPAAFFANDGKNYKVYSSKIRNDINPEAGKIFQKKDELIIGCGKDALEILELQPEGKRRMKAGDFLRGNRL